MGRNHNSFTSMFQWELGSENWMLCFPLFKHNVLNSIRTEKLYFFFFFLSVQVWKQKNPQTCKDQFTQRYMQDMPVFHVFYLVCFVHFVHLHLVFLLSLTNQELTKCIQLLQTLILDHRLEIQTDLDRKKLEYFEGKCELVLQKIKCVLHLLSYMSQTRCYLSEIYEKHNCIAEYND